MIDQYKSSLSKAIKNKISAWKLLDKLKKTKPKNLDQIVHLLHDESFEVINCLECANCCKTTSPRMTMKDVERIAKALKKPASAVIEEYMDIDDENDYVFRQQPCPMLGPDNYCSIYESRPKACREYPHTNRIKFYQAIPVTKHNMFICPAVANIVNELQKKYTN